MADPISTLPDGSPLLDTFKVPLTEITTDQFGNPFADVVTWSVDDTTNGVLLDVTDTTASISVNPQPEGSSITVTATATDAAGLSASQVVTFTGTTVAPVAASISIAAGDPEPK